jgi:type II secretory pathway pseudopilin PulG
LDEVMKIRGSQEKVTPALAAFTITEAVVALTIIGVGIASFVMGMSQLNREASISRNATGAGAILQNHIDLVLSNGPFNPQKTNEDGSVQRPPELVPGTNRTVIYRDPISGVASTHPYPWPVYREPSRWTYATAADRNGATGFTLSDIGQLAYQSNNQTYWRLKTLAPEWTQDSTEGIIVRGKVTTTVQDLGLFHETVQLYTYRATFTVEYFYRGKKYTVSRDTLRTSDI